VQRSPAIINVAVPCDQHSHRFGHRALSQTVCSRNAPSRPPVRANRRSLGRLNRNQRGSRAGRSVALIVLAVIISKGFSLADAKKSRQCFSARRRLFIFTIKEAGPAVTRQKNDARHTPDNPVRSHGVLLR